MADVFLSYASEERKVAERLAKALEDAGFSVWWDRHIRGGAEFSQDIEREIEAAGRILVLWSKSANQSRWVRDEASAAAESARLIGVSIDASRPPMGFRQFQTLDLTGWARRSGKPPVPSALLEALPPAALGKSPAAPADVAPAPDRRALVAIVALLLIVVAAGGWWLIGQRGIDQVASGEATGAKASLAVVPFKALSGGADDGYLAAGLTEEIVAHLARIPNLDVSGRPAQVTANSDGLRATAKKLGVNHLVEGTVRRSGPRLRVTAKLIRAADDSVLWSGSYDSAAGDMLDIQMRIAAQVAAALDVILSPAARQQMARMRVRNPEAYVAFAKGNEAYDRGHSDGDLLPALVEANRHYDEAFRLAPSLWQAQERGADLYVHLLMANAAGGMPAEFAALGVEGARRELRQRIDTALRSAPNSAERAGLAVIGKAFSDDWTGLLALVRQSYGQRGSCGLETFSMFLGPNHGLARELGNFGRHTVACNRTAAAGWDAMARSELLMGRPAEALAILDRADRAVDVDTIQALKLGRAIALIQLGRWEEARGLSAEMGGTATSRTIEVLIDATRGDRPALTARLDALPPHLTGPKMALSAWSGDRAGANRAAAELDKRPDGSLLLENTLSHCLCGWPFDLSATPIYAARLREAGALVEPPRPLKMPLKTW